MISFKTKKIYLPDKICRNQPREHGTAQTTTSSLIIFHLNLDLAKPNSETLPKLIGKFTRMN